MSARATTWLSTIVSRRTSEARISATSSGVRRPRVSVCLQEIAADRRISDATTLDRGLRTGSRIVTDRNRTAFSLIMTMHVASLASTVGNYTAHRHHVHKLMIQVANGTLRGNHGHSPSRPSER